MRSDINPPPLNALKEQKHITGFVKKTVKQTGVKNVVLGVSGGIDSATSLYILTGSLPLPSIHVVHLYYYDHSIPYFRETVKNVGLSPANIHLISIKKQADVLIKELSIGASDTLRMGNVMARVRMIILYDLAKKFNALVCGTENRSEYHLGYFTRFGDEASDFEPIRHLYKMQVYQLAKHLGVPQSIIDAAPTAGLWQGQTDENELGFSYEEADKVLYLYFERGFSVKKLEKYGYKKAADIIKVCKQNAFKHNVPYVVKSVSLR